MKILILANNSTGLYKFRKELIEELANNNYQIYVSSPQDNFTYRLISLGCNHIETHVDRRGTNPISDLKLLVSYIQLIKHIKPDVVLTYTIKPNVYGGLACRLTKTSYITNITGLGTSIENKGLIRWITLALYGCGLKSAKCVFFQNEPNRQLFIKEKIIRGKSILIPGSGVNLDQYSFEVYPEDNEIIRFLFIGRIMKAKGIDELLVAAKRIKEKYPNVQFDLIGGTEEDYLKQLNELKMQGIINYHGQQENVYDYIKRSHAIILPSYHEGTANVLLESASTGRPIIATRVTGCIETFDEGVTGLGFEVKNAESLVHAIINFIKLPYEKKKSMGIEGRKKMEREFDRCIVVKEYMQEIESLQENLI